jgi:sigma-B regulation protein RsbU (phosphoserine phosphatase)
MYHSVAASPGGMGEWHNWVLVFDLMPDAFTSEDVEVLSLRVSLVGLSLKNLQTVAELRGAKTLIDAEVDRIAEIQRSLLPPDSPDVKGLEVAAKFETFDRAGGDMYDYAKLPNGNWGFMVADASGHGPSAAVVSAMLNAIMHTLPAVRGQQSLDAAEVLCYANAQMSAKRVEQSFVTAVVGMWDPKHKTFAYARAGHPIPLLRRGSKVKTLGDEGDLPLGIFEETQYKQSVQPLSAGDVIVMYTDGVTESRSEDGDMFGEERLMEAMRFAGPSAREVLESIWTAMLTHQATSTPKDDQTVLVLRVKD